jgi:ribosomal protein L16 Arg81 hydroxylase
VDPTTTDVLIRKYGEAVRFRIQGEKVVLCHEGTALSNQLIDEKVLYGVLNAGDTLYIPSRWGHMVRAITKSITVSRDFIDERNVDNYFTSIYKTVQC